MPVPEPVAEHGTYPNIMEHPLHRLTATCLKHWGDVVVGEPFRWSNESVRLSPTQDTSFDEWVRLAKFNRLAPGWPKTFRLFCKICGGLSRHAPKGLSRGS